MLKNCEIIFYVLLRFYSYPQMDIMKNLLVLIAFMKPHLNYKARSIEM